MEYRYPGCGSDERGGIRRRGDREVRSVPVSPLIFQLEYACPNSGRTILDGTFVITEDGMKLLNTKTTLFSALYPGLKKHDEKTHEKKI